MESASHKQLIQQEFTRQAEAFAASPSISDPDRLRRLVEAVNPDPAASVLDVACGPGYLALAFAERCKRVVGIDLTPAPLAIAEQMRQSRHLENVAFQIGDADHLAFTDGEFDVVVSRFAIHHMQSPASIIAEFARVCRNGGTVAIEDLLSSEHPARSSYQNEFERLRDPSHVRALPLTELISLMTAAGLEVTGIYTGSLTPSLERWLANAQTPPAEAKKVREMIERDLNEDLSGARPFRQNGELYFRQTTAALVARKL